MGKFFKHHAAGEWLCPPADGDWGWGDIPCSVESQTKYHIMGYFRISKFSWFCLKKKTWSWFFADFNFHVWQHLWKIILIHVRINCWVGGKSRLSLDRSTVRKENLRPKCLKARNKIYLKQTKITYFHSDGRKKWLSEQNNEISVLLDCDSNPESCFVWHFLP